MVYDRDKDPTFILFCGKAWFHLSQYVNSQNKKKRYAENPMLNHVLQLHVVCCVVVLQVQVRVLGPTLCVCVCVCEGGGP